MLSIQYRYQWRYFVLQLGKAHIVLMITCRMHDTIKEWSSKEFYHGLLSSHNSVANHLLCDIVSGESQILKVPMLLVDTAGCDMLESRIVCRRFTCDHYQVDFRNVYFLMSLYRKKENP